MISLCKFKTKGILSRFWCYSCLAVLFSFELIGISTLVLVHRLTLITEQLWALSTRLLCFDCCKHRHGDLRLVLRVRYKCTVDPMNETLPHPPLPAQRWPQRFNVFCTPLHSHWIRCCINVKTLVRSTPCPVKIGHEEGGIIYLAGSSPLNSWIRHKISVSVCV